VCTGNPTLQFIQPANDCRHIAVKWRVDCDIETINGKLLPILLITLACQTTANADNVNFLFRLPAELATIASFKTTYTAI
jgi:hypothetical protein